MLEARHPASLMLALALWGYPLPPGRYTELVYSLFFSHSDISRKASLGLVLQLPADVICILGSQT